MTLRKRCFFYALMLFILWCSIGHPATKESVQVKEEKIYYGIEANGVLCGYSEINLSPMLKDGRDIILLKQRVFVMISLLGSEVTSEVKLTYHIDPATGKFSYHDSEITQGSTKLDSAIYIEGDTARFTSTTSNEEETTALPPDVILENTLIFPHLIRDFVDSDLEEKSYEIYEVREAEVQKSMYTRVGTENLELAGKSYDTIILNRMSHKTGLKQQLWLDIKNGYVLKAVSPNNRISYRTDSSVAEKIKMVKLDDDILTKANESIADIKAISYMKVKATIEPTGLWVTPESLNVPGQSFSGTVKDNLIEGIFEIEHKRYDGSDAPAFPADFGGDESLKEYLEPEGLIESDDPVLIKEAQEITKGSKNSWEAACRLSEWVAENIAYAIPGGITARKTYDTRSGECGAHSLLHTAFCRAVGIPARVVWGCMYTPNYGGSFGQHGWSEIYMGKVGWIPVDTTAFEIDYADSGHIRLGVFQSMTTAFNAKEMEILDYKAGSVRMGEAEKVVHGKYDEYLGKYTSPAVSNAFTVLVQNGNLAVDIPGQIVLALNDPDEEGLWYSMLSNRLYCTFTRDDLDEVVEMQLHEIIPMPRRSAPEEIDENIPEKFRKYLGKYLFAAVQAEFTVLYRDDSLAINNPMENRVIKLQPPDEKGRWVDEFDKNAIFFESDDEGNVKSMNIDAPTTFRRKMMEFHLTPKNLNLAPGESTQILISVTEFPPDSSDMAYKLALPDGFSVVPASPEIPDSKGEDSLLFQQSLTAPSDANYGDYEIKGKLTYKNRELTSTIKLRVTDSTRILLLAKDEDTEPLIDSILSENSNGMTWLTLQEMRELDWDASPLAQYDLLILDELQQSRPLSPEQMQKIKQYVENGGSFLMFGGWYSCQGHNAENNGLYHDTPIESIVPVTFSSEWDTYVPEGSGVGAERITKPFKLQCADEEHPIAQGIDWQSIPLILGYNRCESVNENGEILAVNENTGDPILVIGEYGRGKVAIFLTAYSRGWAADLKEWDSFNLLWNNIIQWLVSD